MTTGEKIRFYRKQKGLSQKALGELAGGIHEVTIRKYEAGLRNPKPAQLKRIADAMGISVFMFLDIDITTVSDVLSLVFGMDEFSPMTIEGKRNSHGEYDPASIRLHFNNGIINERLALWAKSKDVEKKLKASQDSFDSRQAYEQAIKDMDKKLESIRARLINDDTKLK